MIKGIDVYHGDCPIDWAKVKASGREFVFIKCTEGHNSDPMFHDSWTKAKAAGLLVGAYHFFHPAQDVDAQVQAFLKTMGPLTPGCLPPVLDWETHELSPQEEVQAGLAWLRAVQSATGKAPIIYAGAYYIGDLNNPPALANYPLWLADYRSTPHVPAPFKDYLFWQEDDTEVVPGHQGQCDCDVFNGSQDQLNALAGL
jgi:lysozyme